MLVRDITARSGFPHLRWTVRDKRLVAVMDAGNLMIQGDAPVTEGVIEPLSRQAR